METTPPRKSRLLLLPEVAERIRKTEAQTRFMVRQKQMPAPAKIAGRLTWREDDIEAWIDEQFAKASA